MNATFSPVFPPAGPIAFSSQSGALGLAILETAKQLDLGISSFVSVGNKADVSTNDLLESWGSDPQTSVILLYVESFGNPRRFRPDRPAGRTPEADRGREEWPIERRGAGGDVAHWRSRRERHRS